MADATTPRPEAGRDLAERMRRGEESAFSEFAERYAPRFRAYLIRHGLPVTQAEELACTVVTEVALRIDQFVNQGADSFDRWAFTLAYRLYVAWLRQRAKEARELEAAAAVARCSARKTVASPRAELIRSALAKLSEAEREVLLLRSLAVPFTFAEIGKELRISESAARVRHHRTLARLREILLSDPKFREVVPPASEE